MVNLPSEMASSSGAAENIDQPSQLQEFTRFGSLPPELRIKIWELALPGPRLIFIAGVLLNTKTRATEFKTNTTIPKIIFTTRKSRQVATRRLPLVLKTVKTSHGRVPIRINLVIDTAYFPDWLASQGPRGLPGSGIHLLTIDYLRHSNPTFSPQSSREIINFQGLEMSTIILHRDLYDIDEEPHTRGNSGTLVGPAGSGVSRRDQLLLTLEASMDEVHGSERQKRLIKALFLADADGYHCCMFRFDRSYICPIEHVLVEEDFDADVKVPIVVGGKIGGLGFRDRMIEMNLAHLADYLSRI